MKKEKGHIQLDQFGKEFPLRVPDGYWDELTAKVMARTEKEIILQKESYFLRFIKPALGFAACFLIIMALIYYPKKGLLPGSVGNNQSSLLTNDEEFLLTYPLEDKTIYETLENKISDDHLNIDQLESVLLASVSEYELIDLKN